MKRISISIPVNCDGADGEWDDAAWIDFLEHMECHEFYASNSEDGAIVLSPSDFNPNVVGYYIRDDEPAHVGEDYEDE